MNRTLLAATVLLAIGLALIGCGGGSVEQPTPAPATPVSLDYDHSSAALVIEADTYGGLLPPAMARHVAEVRIYGDGLVVLAREGEMLAGGTDRAVMTGHLSEEELNDLLGPVADSGFFQLEDRYQPSAAPTDLPSRYVTVNLIGSSKTVTIYPPDFDEGPQAFYDVYNEIGGVSPPDAAVFTPASGTMTALDLGPIDDLPAGERNQVAPWDTPLVGIALPEATEPIFLESEEYRVVGEFLLRYPLGQRFGSQEGRVYQVRLEADLPWEDISP